MITLILQALAALVSAVVIGVLETTLGWDNTDLRMIVIIGIIIFLPQLIVRIATYKERLTTAALIVGDAVRISRKNCKKNCKWRSKELMER